MIIKNKWALLEYAENKNMPAIFDVLNNAVYSNDVPLAATDGSKVYINSSEFDKLSVENEFFVLCHELLHITYQHHKMSHVDFPNRKLLNLCQDVVINEYLAKKLRYKYDAGVYLDTINKLLQKERGMAHREYVYQGVLTTKALYRTLYKHYANNDDFKNYVNGYNSDQLIPKDSKKTPQGNDSQQDNSTQELSEVISELRGALKVTDDLIKRENRLADIPSRSGIKDVSKTGRGSSIDVPKQKINTISKEGIVKFIRNYIGNHAVIRGRSQTYTRPNRRIQSKDFILKGYKLRKNIKEIFIYLDVSGSMDYRFIQEVYNTLEVLHQTTKFKFYIFDIDVYRVYFKGSTIHWGGGTNITRVLEHIKNEKHDVSILITDCEDDFTLKGVKSDLFIFTNNESFVPDNPRVKCSYWV